MKKLMMMLLSGMLLLNLAGCNSEAKEEPKQLEKPTLQEEAKALDDSINELVVPVNNFKVELTNRLGLKGFEVWEPDDQEGAEYYAEQWLTGEYYLLMMTEEYAVYYDDELICTVEPSFDDYGLTNISINLEESAYYNEDILSMVVETCEAMAEKYKPEGRTFKINENYNYGFISIEQKLPPDAEDY